MRCSICDQSITRESVSNISEEKRQKVTDYVYDPDPGNSKGFICIDCQEGIDEVTMEWDIEEE